MPESAADEVATLRSLFAGGSWPVRVATVHEVAASDAQRDDAPMYFPKQDDDNDEDFVERAPVV